MAQVGIYESLPGSFGPHHHNGVDDGDFLYFDARRFGLQGAPADDTIPIVNALTASMGCRLWFPPGHFRTSQFPVPPNITISGAAKTHDTTLGTYIEFINAAGSGLTHAAPFGGAADYKRIKIADMTFIGNATLDRILDFSGSAVHWSEGLELDNVEVRGPLKATGDAIYLKDASHYAFNDVMVRRGNILGTALHLLSPNANSGVGTFRSCAFGDTGISLNGVYFEDGGAHLDGIVFEGCGLLGGNASGGNCIYFKTPGHYMNILFNGCHLENKNELANGALIYIDGATYGVYFNSCKLTGFDIADYGFHFVSAIHRGFKAEGTYFNDIQAGGTLFRIEAAASFRNSFLMGSSRSNATTPYSGNFAGAIRSGFDFDNFAMALPVYVNNAGAIAGGLMVGQFYRLNGDPDHICVVH
jgi:hypothetical protein